MSEQPHPVTLTQEPRLENGWWEGKFTAGCGHEVEHGSTLRFSTESMMALAERFYKYECPECRRREV